MTESLFFDTYAFVEMYKGNNSYKKYGEYDIITTKLNIFEIYMAILRENDEKGAEKLFSNYYPFAHDFNEEIIKEAVKLKIKINKRDVSMTDCIGYTLAKQLGIKFLTGDSQFIDLENVEFVK